MRELCRLQYFLALMYAPWYTILDEMSIFGRKHENITAHLLRALCQPVH
jgi:hypothetical protein